MVLRRPEVTCAKIWKLKDYMNRFHRMFCRSSYWNRRLETELLPWALRDLDLGPELLEVGAGPGLTTDLLRQRFANVTALEIDDRLASSLKQRLEGTNVRVLKADATAMPLPDSTFSGAVSFTMLHHVPSADLQDKLLAEVYRVLKPGGTFAGTDSRWSRLFQFMHIADTMVLVDPDTFGDRLEAVGFTGVDVGVGDRSFRFRARRPQ